jgi:hypothetical protein
MSVPSTKEEGRAKANHGADQLREVARGKDASSRLDPGRDTSAINAEKAVRERWSKGGGPTLAPDRGTTP